MSHATPRLPRLAILFALGAVVGTAADQLHVRAGVLSYPGAGPRLAGQPAWVPLLFGGAGVVLPLANAALLSLARARPPAASAGAVARTVLWFFAAYAATALFHGAPVALAAGLLLAWSVRVALRPALDALLAGPLLGLAGSLFEAGLSSTGAFRYAHPDLLLVPVWLPALYLHASLMTRAACLALLPPPAPAAASPRAAPR